MLECSKSVERLFSIFREEHASRTCLAPWRPASSGNSLCGDQEGVLHTLQTKQSQIRRHPGDMEGVRGAHRCRCNSCTAPTVLQQNSKEFGSHGKDFLCIRLVSCIEHSCFSFRDYQTHTELRVSIFWLVKWSTKMVALAMLSLRRVLKGYVTM